MVVTVEGPSKIEYSNKVQRMYQNLRCKAIAVHQFVLFVFFEARSYKSCKIFYELFSPNFEVVVSNSFLAWLTHILKIQPEAAVV